MHALSPLIAERSRKNASAILRAFAAAGQNKVADLSGVSETLISRWNVDQVAAVLAAAGVKVVPDGMKCFPSKDVEAWYGAYRREVMRAETAEQLFDDLQ
jgi:hypothetical protein